MGLSGPSLTQIAATGINQAIQTGLSQIPGGTLLEQLALATGSTRTFSVSPNQAVLDAFNIVEKIRNTYITNNPGVFADALRIAYSVEQAKTAYGSRPDRRDDYIVDDIAGTNGHSAAWTLSGLDNYLHYRDVLWFSLGDLENNTGWSEAFGWYLHSGAQVITIDEANDEVRRHLKYYDDVIGKMSEFYGVKASIFTPPQTGQGIVSPSNPPHGVVSPSGNNLGKVAIVALAGKIALTGSLI